MELNEKPDVINWPVTHYVFLEKIGPFQETAPKAWQGLHQNVAQIKESATVTGYLSLYKIKPEMIYRAGVAVTSPPEKLPEGFQYIKFEGGKYYRFVLRGSYANLPQACGRVFEIVEKTKLAVRDGFYIENYVNNPNDTAEADLITEILIPAN